MKNLILTIAMAAVASGVMFAQAPAPVPATPPVTKPGAIEKRKDNQQKRIAQGVRNGSLTAKETAKLETRESNLNKKIATERTTNGGKLTPAERKQVNRRQNSISKDIASQKHDAQTQK